MPDRPPDDGPPTEPLDGQPVGDDELLWPPDGYADMPVDPDPRSTRGVRRLVRRRTTRVGSGA